MTGIIELRERISVETPLGHGYAAFLESGAEDNWWTVFLDNGAIVSFTQDRIRVSRAYGYRRGIGDAEMQEIVQPRRGGNEIVTPKQMVREMRRQR